MRLGTKQVNIGLDKSIALDLNKIVKESNLVRDAFFNRLIAFLPIERPASTTYSELPKHEDGRVGKNYANIAKPVSPLAALSDTFDDPLWYLHMAAKEIHDTSLYLLSFPSPTMDGFACWIADEEVPGTKSNRLKQRQLDDLVRNLEEFELETLIPTRPR